MNDRLETTVKVRLDGARREALEKIATEKDRPVAWVIRAAIDDYLNHARSA